MLKKIKLEILVKISAIPAQKRQFIRLVRKIFSILPRAIKKTFPLELTVIFVSDNASRELNSRYRKKQKPANVLSFIYNEYAEIFITPAIIKKEAKKNKETYLFYLAKMIIHGMIHASGKDHELSKSAELEFETLEKKILKQLFGLQVS